nr:MAG TPA: minor capsid protein [Caudoviricetes sp.]
MNDFEIEERINTLLTLIDKLELDILKLEAKTVSKAIDKKIFQKDEIIREYYRELNTLINNNIDSIDEDAARVITDNAEIYLKTNIKTYKEAFKKGIIKASPVITKANKKILANSIKNGKKIINNVLKDIKINSNNQVSNIITKALTNVNSGVSREEAIIEASRSIIDKGINIKDSAGRNWRDVTAYIRMNVKSIGSKTYILQQEQLAKDIGIPERERKIETSSHYGSRPEHAKWQGKVFSYKDFVRICKPNTIEGICGANCRHRYFEYIEGVSKPVFEHYNEQEDKERYIIQQRQRYIEANIRKYKRELAIAEGLGADTSKSKSKIKEWQAIAREHTSKYNLIRQYEREKIS